MTLVEVQELLNKLGAYFRVYVNNEDSTGCSYLVLEIYHSDEVDTTQIAFDMNGLDGMIISASQKV